MAIAKDKETTSPIYARIEVDRAHSVPDALERIAADINVGVSTSNPAIYEYEHEGWRVEVRIELAS